MTDKPVAKFEAGAIQAAIWVNSRKDKDGKSYNMPSVTIQRTYKGKDGEYARTSSLMLNDLPKAIIVIDQSYRFLLEKKDEAQE